jgi:hypothetical protein
MKLLKNLAITGSLGMIAFAGLASASTIEYNQTLTGNGFYAGNGNSAEHFATLTDGNLQLAIRAGNRYTGDPVLVPVGDNYDYNNNENTDPTKNWGFYYSIDTRAGGGTGLIGDYSYTLTLVDQTAGQTFSYDPLVSDDSYYNGTGVHGGNGNNTGVPEGDANYSSLNDAAQAGYYGVQNANWPGYFVVPSFDPSHTYSITLSALAHTQGAVAQDLTIRVNGTPEPGTILTMLGSLGALGLFVRRRKA